MPFSYDDLLGYATNAGFTGPSAQTAAAIGMAESGGNPDAINYSDPGGSFGVMQINGSAWGEEFAAGALDPQTAMNDAYYVSGGGSNFSPWSTFTSGAYKNYLPGSPSSDSSQYLSLPGGIMGEGGIVNTQTGQVIDSGTGVQQNAPSWYSGLTSFLSFITSAQGLERIGVVVIGIILLLIAGFMLATKGFEGTINTVTRAAEL